MMHHENNSLPKELVASALIKDERVIEAKKMIREAVLDHQKSIKDIRPAINHMTIDYQKLMKSYSEIRGTTLWHPYLGSGFGNGPLVELADGSVKYDMICGIGPNYWGHNHLDLIEAGIESALSDVVMQGNLQPNIDSYQLIKILTEIAGLAHCFLTTSGAMANENGLKIAFQKNYPANRILAFEGCFAGRSFVTSQINDKPGYREKLPCVVAVDYIPFFDNNNPQESTTKTLETLKKYLSRYPHQYAVMCFELIQGEGGFYTATKEFFTAIMTVLKEHQIAILVDEVQSFARTPELFAFQYYGLEAFVDIVTIGKTSQACATLFKEDFKPQPGLLSQTFTASTSAIKSALVILKQLTENGYFGNEGKIAKLHEYFTAQLFELASQYPNLITGPYGIGSMIAFTPYKGEATRVTDFVHRLFEKGVIAFIAGGGSKPMRVRFLIPVGCLSIQDIDQIMKIVKTVLLES